MFCQEKVTFLKPESTQQLSLYCGPASCCSSNLHFAERETLGKTFRIAARRGGPPFPLYTATCKYLSAGIGGRNSELDQEIDPIKKIRYCVVGRFLGKLDQFCNLAHCTVARSCLLAQGKLERYHDRVALSLSVAAGLEPD